MVHTASGMSGVRRMYDVAQSCKTIQDEIDALGMGEPGSPSQSIITIEVKGGAVTDVKGVPDGYQYEILDRDLGCIEGEPPFEALYLATVNILIRATSRDRSAGAITHIMSDYDMADGALVDWDYATLDGWCRRPRFVSTNLEPDNTTELLNLI